MIRPIIFGKFVLLERISVGGMAEVYRAKLLNAPHFNRFLAVKRILPNLAADNEFITMFIDEAKITVELNHPNICQIYELGRLEDSHYIAMEYIPGRDLLALQNRYRRQKKIMSVSQACFVTAQVAQGLDYAHRAVDTQGRPLHLIHRDVSPQNALVSFEGLIKLIDFGVAKAASKNTKTQAGVLKGKFGYMSPEQIDGESIVDHRSDIFALGTVFWELLTGRRLFHGDNEFATLELVRECEVVPPSKLNRLVPTQIEAIAMKALERDPDRRYQWAGEMVRDLWEFINNCNPPYTQWHLQNWMCTNFAEDLEKEWEKLPVFQSINTSEDVQRFNQAQVAQAEANMRAQMAAFQEPARDFEGNLIPELSDIDTGGESTQVYTPEFNFASMDNNAIEAGATTPGAVPPASPAQSSAPPPANPHPPAAAPTPARPGPAPTLAAPLPNSAPDVAKAAQPNATPVPTPPRPPAPNAPPGLPRLGADAPQAPPENPLFMSIYQMEAVHPAHRKANRTRNILIALIVVLSLVFLGLGVYWYQRSAPAAKTAAAPGPVNASLAIVIAPPHDQALVRLITAADEKEVAFFGGDYGDPPARPGHYDFTDVTPGRYVLEVEHPDYETDRREVSLAPGPSKVRIELQHPKITMGVILVTLPFPDVEILIEGEEQSGEGLTRRIELPVGREYEIYVKKPGYMPYFAVIEPRSDRESTLKVEMEKGVATVTVKSAPTADLWLLREGNWEKVGPTPQTIADLDPTEPCFVEVRKNGFQTWTKEVTFEDQFDKSFLATLSPK